MLTGFPKEQIPEAASEKQGLVLCCPLIILLLTPFPSSCCLFFGGFSMILLGHFAFGGDPISGLYRAESFSFMRFCCSSQLKTPHCSHLLVASHPGLNVATGLCDCSISSATSVGFRWRRNINMHVYSTIINPNLLMLNF